MQKSRTLFLNLYLVAAIVHIFSLVTRNTSLQDISKVVLMPLLIMHVFIGHRAIKKFLPLFIALFCSWLGDIFLLRNSETRFMAGLASFLAAHIFYIIAFLKLREHKLGKNTAVVRMLPFLAYAILIDILIYPGTGDMKIPVLLYSATILMMGSAASWRIGTTDIYSGWFTVAGAVLFMLSDTLIALNKFYTAVGNAEIWIMLTYITAQYLLVSGCLLHGEKPVLQNTAE